MPSSVLLVHAKPGEVEKTRTLILEQPGVTSVELGTDNRLMVRCTGSEDEALALAVLIEEMTGRSALGGFISSLNT